MIFKIKSNLSLNSLPALIIPIDKQTLHSDKLDEIVSMTSLSVAQVRQDFKAAHGTVHLIYTSDAKLFLLGVGEQPNTRQVLLAFRKLAHQHAHQLPSTVGIHLLEEGYQAAYISAAVNGLLLGQYRIGKYKTSTASIHPLESDESSVTIFTKLNAQVAENAAAEGAATAATQRSIMHLVNAPSNKKPPQVLADWAVASGEANGYEVTVFEKERIVELGLGALLAVNRGSETPPRFIIMEYKGEGAMQKIGLLGKGVTFDTGGLSIKTAAGMPYMKSDMGGAAAVLGTIDLAAKLKLPVHLIGIIPATDNSVDALSIKPSDVITSYSGKTIEIIDTDAEGRLILADALAYMCKHFQPDVMIDLATLTGSAVRALGYEAGALFSKNEALAKSLALAGEQTGEKLWQLPLWDEYLNDIQSDVADIKNLSSKPIAGAIIAAKFLEFFTDKHPAWAHLDIAGVAFSDMQFSRQKSATAFGIRLLVDYLKNL